MVTGAQLAAPEQAGPLLTLDPAQDPQGFSKVPPPVKQRSGSDDSSGCHFDCPLPKEEQEKRWPGQEASRGKAVPDGGGRPSTDERVPSAEGCPLGGMDPLMVRPVCIGVGFCSVT